ncbi:MAG: hypothetical protein R3B13_15410 [Polyangiaceae bacterium]
MPGPHALQYQIPITRGGLSVGILHSTASTLNDTPSTFTAGTAGNAGNRSGAGNNGVVGQTQGRLAL